MEMEKMYVCRICLVENVRMYVFANTNLQETYEKLTDIPLVTEDRRPMLACFICYAKLKQCHQFQRKCLKTEKLFAQLLNEDFETKLLLHQNHLEHSGYVITPIVHLDVIDDAYSPAESDVVKVELPVFDCEDDKQQSGSKQKYKDMVNVDMSPCSSIIYTTPHHSTSVAEDDPLTEFKFELEGEDTIYQEKVKTETKESSKQKYKDMVTVDISPCSPMKYTTPHHSTSDAEDDPLTEFKFELEEDTIYQEKVKTETKESSPALKKLNLEDTIVTRRKHTELQDTKYIGNTLFTSNPVSESNKDSTHTTVVIDSVTIPPTDNSYKKMYNYCAQCKLSFNSSLELTKHTRAHPDHISNKLKSSVKNYECNICRQSFSRKNDLRKHFSRHTSEKRFKCEICKRSFRKNGSLARHIIKCEKHYKCDICQRVFTKKSYLLKHIRIHRSVGKHYICDICQSSFREKGCLTRHMLVHTNKKPYNCDQCPFSFKRKDHLNKHRSIHNHEKPFQCDACGRLYKDKVTLKDHIKRHNSEKPYKCDICQRKFREKISKTHSLKCTGEKSSSNSLKTQKVCIKSFKCDICERSYSLKSSLNRHIRTHTNEKPFQCKVCYRSFRYLHHLKEHNLIHTGVKPYKCDICKSEFLKASYIKVHMRMHTGEKPYKCEFCQRSFNRADNLKQHVGTHTGERRIRKRKPVT